MNRKRIGGVLFVLAMAACAASAQLNGPTIGGTILTKWLWDEHGDDGQGGQGTEIELLLSARLSKQVEVKGRLQGRFAQNFWTHSGGFGEHDPVLDDPPAGNCAGGDCDSRFDSSVKLRGVSLTLTPGYRWIDSATIGSNDFGQFDPFVIGRFRYLDRDSASGLLFQGSGADRKFTWDATRISLPRRFSGSNFTTGKLHAADAVYGLQAKLAPSSKLDFGLIASHVNDLEVDGIDRNLDEGRDIRTQFRDTVIGAKFGFHPSSKMDLAGAIYHSSSDSADDLTPANFFGLAGFSPVPLAKHDDESWKVDVAWNDPFGNGFSLSAQLFDVGAEYVALMAARRESDVLLTEGHDATYAFPGPANASFGVLQGNPSRIGLGGWNGNMQQVATINVDNEVTDFDEPAAETVIGWKGLTIAPTLSLGGLDLAGEITVIGYNTNWQAFGDSNRSVTSTVYPVHELDTGVGHNFRSAYAPFQDKKTTIGLIRARYLLDAGKGVDLFGKIKLVDESDKRLNDARFLPYEADSCPGGGQACADPKHFYSPGNSTAEIYGNPPVITVGGVTGYSWKPFDSLSDDDRDLHYRLLQIGAGYQLTDDLYASLTFERYDTTLQDGNTAFQAYGLHELASGDHSQNKISVKARYVLAGAEIGFEYQVNKGIFDPNFGGGFVPQVATEQIAKDHQVPVGSLGFTGRFGGWNSLEKRDFSQQRVKAFLKVQF
ncbi:MAG TPA: hypothetical protein VGS22_23360 [Thermoanaerobaculia bacterium]|jgi:hypothetical protein|nr:hypothetical protein [Thermoanaerobaculia bacterium]